MFSHLLKQAFWKGFKQRKSYVDRLKVFQGNVDAIIKVRSHCAFGLEYAFSWLGRPSTGNPRLGAQPGGNCAPEICMVLKVV